MTKPTSRTVLVIDDEPQIRRFLRAGFELDDFVVREAENAAEGIKLATIRTSDLVILDLGLPDMDGADVVECLRAWSNVPIIVLSVRAEEDEKVRLLELGADDYVVKPFGMAELLARARAALRRNARAPSGEPVVTVGPLSVDFSARIVSLDGHRLPLTPKEYRLLQVLTLNAGKVVTHQQGGLGVEPCPQYPVPADPDPQAQAEDRVRPEPAAHPGDRAWRRLPADAAQHGSRGQAARGLAHHIGDFGPP